VTCSELESKKASKTKRRPKPVQGFDDVPMFVVEPEDKKYVDLEGQS
jgi:hypothetical protein